MSLTNIISLHLTDDQKKAIEEALKNLEQSMELLKVNLTAEE